MIKLVVCDIDNTLVEKHKDPTDHAFEMIKQLQDKGVLFGLASGRPVDSLHMLEDKWGIKCDLIIGTNGSEYYDGLTDEHVIYYMMEAEWIKEAFDIMRPFDVNPTMGKNGKWMSLKMDEKTKNSGSYLKNSSNVLVAETEEEFYSERAFKIGFRTKAEDMPAIEAHAAKFHSDNWKTVKTEKDMFEFCHKDSSKGKMLEVFCQKHNIDMSEVCAFGDMSNDVDMLEVAGLAVCLLNGSDDAKAVSDEITEKTIADDGWADYVEKHLLDRVEKFEEK